MNNLDAVEEDFDGEREGLPPGITIPTQISPQAIVILKEAGLEPFKLPQLGPKIVSKHGPGYKVNSPVKPRSMRGTNHLGKSGTITLDKMGRKQYDKQWMAGGEEAVASMRRRVQQREEAKDEEFRERLASMTHEMDAPDGALRTADAILERTATLRHRKRAELHEEWQSEVFSKIQNQIERHVDSISIARLERTLNSRAEAYNAASTRGRCSLEVINTAVYDPFANVSSFKVNTGELRDPTDREIRKDAYERSLLRTAGCSYPLEPPSPVGAVGRMRPTEWLGATYSETMHGRHYNSHGAVQLRGAHKTAERLHAALQGKVAVDHYTFPRENSATAEDFAPGGRGPIWGSITEEEARRLRGGAVAKIMRAEAAQVKRGQTGSGDVWLDWRGKGPSEGPGADFPRSMFEVVTMRPEPVGGGGPAQDAWMSAKGKQMTKDVNAGDPRELFEVMSHAATGGAKVPGGCTEVRDAWSVYKGRRPGPKHDTLRLLYLEEPGGGSRQQAGFASGGSPSAVRVQA